MGTDPKSRDAFPASQQSCLRWKAIWRIAVLVYLRFLLCRTECVRRVKMLVTALHFIQTRTFRLMSFKTWCNSWGFELLMYLSVQVPKLCLCRRFQSTKGRLVWETQAEFRYPLL